MPNNLVTPLLKTLDEVRSGLASIIRWQKFASVLPIRRETCLEHSYDTVLLAIVVSEIVRTNVPARRFDAYRLVGCAALHDIGEIVTGDIAYADRVSGDAEREACAFQGFFAWLPTEAQRGVSRMYSIQTNEAAMALGFADNTDSTTSLLFEFVERYGYLIFALEQVRAEKENLPLLRHVLGNQLDRLRELLATFPELQILLPVSQQDELVSLAHAHSNPTS